MGSFEKVSPEEINLVRKAFNVTESDIKTDVDILISWYKQQRHLPQNVLDRELMERMLLRNKFRIEKTKQKIDSYFTVKGLFKKFYENNMDISPANQLITTVSLEHMTDKQQRIYFAKLHDVGDRPDALLNSYRSVFLVLDLDFMYDYSAEIVSVFDFNNFSLQSYLKLDMLLIVEYSKVFQDIYAGRFKEMHFINGGKVLNLFLTLCRPVVKKKYYERIHIHENLKSLQAAIPLKYLPSDYGGEQKSLKEHMDLLTQSFKDHKRKIETHINKTSDESLRLPDNPYKNQYFGTDGTFKKLDID